MIAARLLAAAALAALLAGCAGSVSAPVPVTPLGLEQKAALRLSAITADAAPDVTMSKYDLDVVKERVRTYLQVQSPQVFAATDGALTMRIHFTRFDRGNTLARGMMIGLGQIIIEATVTLEDAHGAIAGQYKVSKDFAIGGLIGAMTTTEDVEDGFAKSVAAILK
jgi:hypothetical protein